MEDITRAKRAEQAVDSIINFMYLDPETETWNPDQDINGGDLVEHVAHTLASYGFVPGQDEEVDDMDELPTPQFVLTLPDGLKDYIKSYSDPQLRRRLNVYINGRIGIPGTHYALQDDREAIYISMQRKEVEAIVIADPRLDEKWYWQPHSWGRL